MLGRTDIRKMIKNGEPIISVMLRYPVAAHLEIFAKAGISVVCIDNEHYPFDPETLIDLIRAADCNNMAVVVRVPSGDPARIAQIMDMGADGIWLPGCNSYEEARAAVDAVKFAPVGKRGFCPITRANCYGLSGVTSAEFAAFSNEKSVVMVQIESKEGYQDLDRILTLEDVDVIEYGASDLAASYGKPGHNTDPDIVEKIEDIWRRAIAVGKGVPITCHDTATVIKRLEEGYRYLSLGSDQQLLSSGIKSLVGEVTKVRN